MWFIVGAQDRLKLVTEVKDNIEIVHTQEYETFLKYLFPAFRKVLEELTSPPRFTEGPLQKIRYVVLEILYRLPYNEVSHKIHYSEQ